MDNLLRKFGTNCAHNFQNQAEIGRIHLKSSTMLFLTHILQMVIIVKVLYEFQKFPIWCFLTLNLALIN